MNPVRKLRDALGWSQSHFAQVVGRSYQTVRNWEAGHRVPSESLEKMKSIATESGLADIALELSSEEWQVRRVFDPGETIISQAKPAERMANRERLAEREKAHRLVDEIYDCRDSATIAAVFQSLTTVARLIRLAGKSAAIPRKTK